MKYLSNKRNNAEIRTYFHVKRMIKKYKKDTLKMAMLFLIVIPRKIKNVCGNITKSSSCLFLVSVGLKENKQFFFGHVRNNLIQPTTNEAHRGKISGI